MSGTPRSWKRKGSLLPQSLQKKCGPANTLISDFRPPEWWENKQAGSCFTTWFVIICYSMLRKLGQFLFNKLYMKVTFQREDKFQNFYHSINGRMQMNLGKLTISLSQFSPPKSMEIVIMSSQCLDQQSPTFLASGTSFIEDNFSMDLGGGREIFSSWFKCITFTVCFISMTYYIGSISDH